MVFKQLLQISMWTDKKIKHQAISKEIVSFVISLVILLPKAGSYYSAIILQIFTILCQYNLQNYYHGLQ